MKPEIQPPSDHSMDPVSSNRPRMNLSLEAIGKNIDKVRDLIERCLQLYMTREEAVHILSAHYNIEPVFTNMVWKRLEEENPSFFYAYNTWMRLKRQIKQFNDLLGKQYQLMQQYSTISGVASQNIGTYDLLHNQMPTSASTLQLPSIPLLDHSKIDGFDHSYLNSFQHRSVHIPPNVHSMPTLMESQGLVSMTSNRHQMAIAPNYGQSLMSMTPNGQFHLQRSAYVDTLTNTGMSTLDSFSSHLPIGQKLRPYLGDIGSSRESFLPMTPIPWDLSIPELPEEDLKISVDELLVDPPSSSNSSSSLHLDEERP